MKNNINNEKIFGINGSIVTIKNSKKFSMGEMVFVGNKCLVGEVININSDYTTIQVYEETSGLKIGEPVTGNGKPICTRLGPGLLNNIFDGIERPLKQLENVSGAFISSGSKVHLIDENKLWNVTINVKIGDNLKSGEIYATCPEGALTHRFLVPNGISGTVTFISNNGNHKITDKILTLKSKNGKIHDLFLFQDWPIRIPRPVKKRLPLDEPLITGQRVIDSLFPIPKGGAAAVPGGFGAGKTMTQHQLAKWCDADIIVYVGCGERGNEMSQVVDEFSKLKDPKNGRMMMERTVLIANTSNMPVAAREASIYTGITIAEYYRDMGYHVAIMADSTSRWAEALREISGRLEEMPAEEGFPAYLPSRLADFYERAGKVITNSKKTGSVTIIGAVSPQGADFSEPVTQNTKRFTRCFWALDKNLAYARHYPAINWNLSYSEYFSDLKTWFEKNLDQEFLKIRSQIMQLLLEEGKLNEIVNLAGSDVLPEDQKLILEVAKVIRLGFLQQNAFHEIDTSVPLEKQKLMMEIILKLYEKAKLLVAEQIPISLLVNTGIFSKLIKMKYDIPNDDFSIFDVLSQEIDIEVKKILNRHQ